MFGENLEGNENSGSWGVRRALGQRAEQGRRAGGGSVPGALWAQQGGRGQSLGGSSPDTSSGRAPPGFGGGHRLRAVRGAWWVGEALLVSGRAPLIGWVLAAAWGLLPAPMELRCAQVKALCPCPGERANKWSPSSGLRLRPMFVQFTKDAHTQSGLITATIW